jgi:uncharacterized protein
MRKLDPATYRTMPWKNGGGTTTEAFILPAGATLDDFEIRVSMARIEADGPFSRYLGIDRTLVVTDGAGLALATSDGAELTLDQGSPPFSFTGGDPIHAKLVAGPVADFNVMTRRSVLRHRAEKVLLDGDEARTVACSGELTLLVVLEGAVVARDDAAPAGLALARGEVLMLAAADGQVQVDPVVSEGAPEPTVLLVDIFRR